jgi:hypothetical protein
VVAFYRRYGLVLLLGAAGIAVDRIVVGVHYPIDVAGSLLIGLGSSLLVNRLGRGIVGRLARLLSRVSDPVVDVVRSRIVPIRNA